jgi:hypothetical protein
MIAFSKQSRNLRMMKAIRNYFSDNLIIVYRVISSSINDVDDYSRSPQMPQEIATKTLQCN